MYFAPRFRQLRVITAMEAVRQRFGRTSEQAFVWLQIPLGTLQAGIWLNALGVFFSAIFGFDLTWTILVTGIVVLFLALFGGAWAVLAGDFVQVLILMPVCVVVTVLVLARLGGWHGLASAVPAGHLDLSTVFSREFLGLWCLAMLFKQFAITNNLLEATRYLSVKDSRQARRAGLLGAGLFLAGLAIWFLPPMAARALWPDLQAMMPGLRNPAEASFIVIARDVMPVGMMGLLVSGIFAATMSSMDAGLNKNAGIFIKNFYQPLLRPAATDRDLLRIGRIATVALGAIIVGVAVWMSHLRGFGLFLLMQRVSILVAVPIAVPLVLGLVVRNTPAWSAWSTVLVGFVSSLFVGTLFPPEWGARLCGYSPPLDATTREYWTQGFQFFATVGAGTLWFLLTRIFWRRTAPAERERIAAFFARLNTPVDFDREEGKSSANDHRQETVIGRLALTYGAFVVLLAAIPNATAGRLAFVFCGLVVAGTGGLLLRSARTRTRVPC